MTWNDYHCVCPDKYKGRNCSEKDFCQWYSCPGDSVCSALADGHECRTNTTFNGVNSTALYTPGESCLFIYKLTYLDGKNLVLTWIWDVLPSCLGAGSSYCSIPPAAKTVNRNI